jgi:hypothetical protein
LFIIALSRIVAYYYLLKGSLWKLIRYNSITTQTSLNKKVNRKNKVVIGLTSILAVGVPSLALAAYISAALSLPLYLFAQLGLVLALYPLMFSVDILRVNLLSYYLLKRRLLKEEA